MALLKEIIDPETGQSVSYWKINWFQVTEDWIDPQNNRKLTAVNGYISKALRDAGKNPVMQRTVWVNSVTQGADRTEIYAAVKLDEFFIGAVDDI